ncbi:hypothetical protein BH11MYX4_BH11MYX4_30630 [soil metagenome]
MKPCASLAAGLVAGLVTALAACGGPSSSTDPTPTAPAIAPPATSPVCQPTKAEDIEVSGADRDGFPPYAVAGCTLVYVSGIGALVARDLSDGTETVLAGASELPRRPAVSGGLIAWEADESGHSVVRVRANGVLRTVPGAFASAGEPRASGSSVVFTAWSGPQPTDDTDIWLFDATTGESRRVLGGAGQQRFADVSPKYVVATDFSEDADGRFDGNETDVADILVLDRASGVVSSRRLPGKQSFPILGDDDVLAYLEWGIIHPEPKLAAYELRVGKVVGDAATDRARARVEYAGAYARPALAGGTLEWIANPDGVTRLYRAPLDGSTPPAVVRGLDDLRLYAPAPTIGGTERGFTVIAAAAIQSVPALPRLRAVTR